MLKLLINSDFIFFEFSSAFKFQDSNRFPCLSNTWFTIGLHIFQAYDGASPTYQRKTKLQMP
jgi:hypothetical protein